MQLPTSYKLKAIEEPAAVFFCFWWIKIELKRKFYNDLPLSITSIDHFKPLTI